MEQDLLEQRFHHVMLEIYRQAKEECHYTATRFRNMVRDLGGLEAGKRLINSSEPSDGFTTLWECKRIDLTVEAHALKPEYRGLIASEELERAKRRLQEYGYHVP